MVSVTMEKNIGWEEYAVFSAVLISSMGIGVYYGCFGSRQKSTKEFLLANRQMSSIPVALSLICSAVSAITLLSNPVEIYLYGTQYIMSILTFIPFNLALAYLYIPVYFNLNVNSAYQFIEIRFDTTVRLFISILAVLHVVVSMAIAVYAPSLAIQQVTGVDTKISTALIYLVCIFYSALGGLKAVLWADVLQAAIMLASLLAIVIKGVSDIGGLEIVWERAELTGRVQFLNFDPDPRTRHTIWTCLLGGYFFWLPSYASTQLQVQRFLSMPTLSRARRALVINFFGLIVIIGLCFFTGLVILARFYDCDPIGSKDISKSDQLVPYFVEFTSIGVPGLLGLFIAGLTSASMSSLSSGLSALSSITTYDYVSKLWPHFSDTKLSRISKVNTFVLGMVSFGFVFVVENMGSILPATSSLLGIMLGPTLGLFSLGMFFPWANAKGSLTGLILTFAIMITFVIGNNIVSSDLPSQTLPLPPVGCTNSTISTTVAPPNSIFEYDDFKNDWKDGEYSTLIQIMSMSYMWYSTLSCCLSVFLGLICSLIFNQFSNEKRELINSKCISPPILRLWRKLLPVHILDWVSSDDVDNNNKSYSDFDKMDNILTENL